MELRKLRSVLLGGLALALVLIAALLPAVADASPAATSTTTTAPGSASTPGTTTVTYADNPTVTIGVPRLPEQLNPWAPAGANAITTEIMSQVLPQASVVEENQSTVICTTQVVTCSSDLLVQAEPVSIDPLTVVYEIAPAARWSNGSEVTGADFVYLWHEIRVYGSQLPAIDPVDGYDDIASITAPGNGKTVTVVFTEPYADWESLFTNLLPASIGTSGFMTAFLARGRHPVLSGGPFEVMTFVPGRELVLVRNPSFWGTPARVAKIVFRAEATEAATLRGLASGALTAAALEPGSAITAALRASDHLVATSWRAPQAWQLAFNLADPVIGMPDVRTAFAEAVDRRQLIANTVGLLVGGITPMGNRLFPQGFPGSAGNDSGYHAVDVDQAEALLSAAGYSLDDQGLMVDHGGTPLVIELLGPQSDPLVGAMEAQLQAELLQIGVVMHVRNVPLASLLAIDLPRGEYQVALVPYLMSPYPSTAAQLYTVPVGLEGPVITPADAPVSTVVPTSDPVSSPTSTTEPAGVAARSVPTYTESGSVIAQAVTRDVLGFDDTRVDALFTEAFSELNTASDDEMYNQIDTLLWQDLPSLPLFETSVTIVSSNALRGLSVADTWTSLMWNAQDWTVELNPPSTVTTTTSTP